MTETRYTQARSWWDGWWPSSDDRASAAYRQPRPSVYSATAAAALSATGSPPRHLAAEPASSCSSCMATTTRQQEQGRRFEASRARWRVSCALASSMKDRARLDAGGIQHPDLLRSRSTAKLQWRSASPVSTETGSRQRRHGRHGHGKGWLGNDAHLGPHLGQSIEATWRPCRCRRQDYRRREFTIDVSIVACR